MARHRRRPTEKHKGHENQPSRHALSHRIFLLGHCWGGPRKCQRKPACTARSLLSAEAPKKREANPGLPRRLGADAFATRAYHGLDELVIGILVATAHQLVERLPSISPIVVAAAESKGPTGLCEGRIVKNTRAAPNHGPRRIADRGRFRRLEVFTEPRAAIEARCGERMGTRRFGRSRDYQDSSHAQARRALSSRRTRPDDGRSHIRDGFPLASRCRSEGTAWGSVAIGTASAPCHRIDEGPAPHAAQIDHLRPPEFRGLGRRPP